MKASIRNLVVFVTLVLSLSSHARSEEKPKEFCPIDSLKDSEFLLLARQVITSLGSYTPDSAEGQFRELRKVFVEPGLNAFDELILGSELRSVRELERRQEFEISDTKLERYPEKRLAVVKLDGIRRRWISELKMPQSKAAYYVKLQRTCSVGESGGKLVVSDVRFRLSDDKESRRSKIEYSNFSEIFVKTRLDVLQQEADLRKTEKILHQVVRDFRGHKERLVSILEKLVSKIETLETKVHSLSKTVDILESELEKLGDK